MRTQSQQCVKHDSVMSRRIKCRHLDVDANLEILHSFRSAISTFSAKNHRTSGDLNQRNPSLHLHSLAITSLTPHCTSAPDPRGWLAGFPFLAQHRPPSLLIAAVTRHRGGYSPVLSRFGGTAPTQKVSNPFVAIGDSKRGAAMDVQ